MEPLFLLQIVKASDGVVMKRWAAGTPMEMEIIEAVVARVREKPVGIFRTTRQVEQAVREAFGEAMTDLKGQSVQVGLVWAELPA